MTPPAIPEWVQVFGLPGLALWLMFLALKNRTPDNPPETEVQKLLKRISELEKQVAILMDRSER